MISSIILPTAALLSPDHIHCYTELRGYDATANSINGSARQWLEQHTIT